MKAFQDWTEVTPSDFEHERQGLEWIRNHIPHNQGFRVWTNFTFDGGGVSNEVDCLIAGTTGVFLVELKGNPGKLQIHNSRWEFQDSGRIRSLRGGNPRHFANTKTKRLIDRLRRVADDTVRLPFLTPLVFFHHPSVDLSSLPPETYGICVRDELRNYGKGLIETLLEPRHAGLSIPGVPNQQVNLDDFAQRMSLLGLTPRKESRTAGTWILTQQIHAGNSTEDWIASHASVRDEHSRVRCYVLPPHVDTDTRQDLEERAANEFRVLRGLRHPNVERVLDLDIDGHRGPSIVYEDSGEATSLLAIHQLQDRLSTEEIASFLDMICDALNYCHARGVYHRSLSPDTIFIRSKAHSQPTDLEIRQWTSAVAHRGTTQHVADIDPEVSAYRAPELILDPKNASPATDVFSVGCLAFFLATGQHPSVDHSGRVQTTSHGLDAPDLLRRVDPKLRSLIARTTAANPSSRVASIQELSHYLAQIRHDSARPHAAAPPTRSIALESDPLVTTPPKPSTSVLETDQGEILNVTLEQRLGRGSTGTSWRVLINNQSAVLKVANSADCDGLIDAEASALTSASTPRVVRMIGHGSYKGRRAIATEHAGALSLGELFRQDIPLSDDDRNDIVEQLFQLAVDLESSHVVHGDLHPDHIGVAAPPHDLAIRAFDFSLRPSEGAMPGSLVYADPSLSDRRIIDATDDRYAIVSIAHAVLTGTPPASLGDVSRDSRTVAAVSESLPKILRSFFQAALDRDHSQRLLDAQTLHNAWKTVRTKLLAEEEIARADRSPSASQAMPEQSSPKPEAPISPTCPKCGSTMARRTRRYDGNPFWGCSTYPACKGTRDIGDVADLSTKPSEFPAQYGDSPQDGRKTAITIPHQSPAYHIEAICISAGPREFIANNPSHDPAIGNAVIIQPDVIGEPLPPAHHNALCVVEKILRRGYLYPLSPSLETEVHQCIGCPDAAPGPISHGDPLNDFAFESDEERLFVEKFLLPRLGDANMSCVTSQVSVASLSPQGQHVDRNERVDFVVTDGRKVRIIIEIDGEQHASAEAYDAARDRRLTDSGWTVFRIKAEEVRTGKGAQLDQLLTALAPLNPIRPHSLIEDVFRRCAQAQVAMLDIVRSTRATSTVAIEIAWPAWNDVDTAALSKAVIDDFNQLLTETSTLYGVTPHQILSEPDQIDVLRRVISFRSDRPSAQTPTWSIQDIHLPGRYALRLRPAEHAPPSAAPAETLKCILHRIFGFDTFREGQLEALSRGLLGKDSIVLLPTGAGKTVVFQLTCLLRPGPGIIVCPLIALMEDQVDNLRRHGMHNAGSISSNSSRAANEQVLADLGSGSILFTYVAPERFQMEAFRLQLRRLAVQMPIACVAIDEAHCVSEWGHDFRTAYLNIARNARAICNYRGQDPPLLALTGTASRSVLRDVQRELDIGSPDAIVTPESFDRKELEFRVHRCHSKEKAAVLEGILAKTAQAFNQDLRRFFTPKGPDSNCGIVFTPHAAGPSQFGIFAAQKAVADAAGVAVGVYASKGPKGTSPDVWASERTKNATDFKNNTTTLLASTNAFGMGVDKPNVRATVHYNIPKSIESLYQEAGRAGRDRKRSLCWVILSDETARAHPEILDPRTPVETLREMVANFGFANADDIARMLYFHTNSYLGIETEMESIQEVLAQLDPISQPRIEILSWTSSDNQKSLEKSLHRLLMIGVVSDYTVEYARQEIQVQIRGASHDYISRRLYDYLANFRRRAATHTHEALHAIASNHAVQDFATIAARRLTEFIYEHIESSRRRALIETLRACQAGIDDEGEFRTRMLDYLQTSRFNKDIDELCEPNAIDAFKATLADELGRAPSESDIAEHLAAHAIGIAESCENPVEAGHLRGEAARALADFPDNPYLLLLRAIAESISLKTQDQAVIEDTGKAIKLLAYDLDSDTLVTLINRTITAAARDHPGIATPVMHAMLAMVAEPRSAARRLSVDQNPLIASAAKHFLIRKIRLQLESVLGDIDA